MPNACMNVRQITWRVVSYFMARRAKPRGYYVALCRSSVMVLKKYETIATLLFVDL